MDIGLRIDTLYALRAARLELSRQVDDLKMKETLEKQAIMDHLKSIGLNRGSGATATASRTSKIVPVPADWEKIFKHITETQEWDLIQRRLGVTAWVARYENGIVIPGTEPSEIFDLSLTKAAR